MASDGVQLSERARQRLGQDEVIWLTTVRQDGQPQSIPVWFLWDGQSLLIYSRPRQQKLRNIRNHPQVALNFNSTETGGDVVWFEGRAEIAEDEPPATANADYVEKYRQPIARIGYDPDRFATDYSTAIRVQLTRGSG